MILGLNLTSANNEDGNIRNKLKRIISPAMLQLRFLLQADACFAEYDSNKNGYITFPLTKIYLGWLLFDTDTKSNIKRVKYYGAVIVIMCIFPILFFIVTGCISKITYDMKLSILFICALTILSSWLCLQKKSVSKKNTVQVLFVTTCMPVITPS